MEPDSRGDLRKGSPAPITFARPAVYEAREQHERFVPKEMQVREGRVENEIKESLCVVHDNPLGSPRTRVFSGHAATNGLQSGCLRARSQSGETAFARGSTRKGPLEKRFLLRHSFSVLRA